MRPEYIEAVEAVRGGWAYWLIYILPACVVWFSIFFTMFFRPLRPIRYQILIICGAFIFSCYLFVNRNDFYVNRIQDTKQANMLTEEEHQDWSADLGSVLNIAFSPYKAFFYCILNLIAAGIVRLSMKESTSNLSKASEIKHAESQDEKHEIM